MDKSAREIAKLLKRNQVTINRAGRIHGIKFPKRKYVPTKKINNDFFKTQTPEMAYILGFIAADGCLGMGKRNGRSLRIKLAMKDSEHLKKMAGIMGFTGKFYYEDATLKKYEGKVYPQCLFAINSYPIFNDLLTYNITPRKSLTLTWPDKLEEKFYPDFIRGYFDGDGWIRIMPHHARPDGTISQTLDFSMVGTLATLTKIKEYVNKILENDLGRIWYHTDSPIYELVFGGAILAENFGKIIYYDENVLKLERKYERFKKWLEIKDKRMTKQDFDNLKLDPDYKY